MTRTILREDELFSSIVSKWADLLGVVVFVVSSNFVFFESRMTSVRLAFSLIFLFFVPGYVIVSALFPSSSARGSDSRERTFHLGMVERLTFSIGASVATVILVGFTLVHSSWGFTFRSLILSLDLTILASVILATYRRRPVTNPLRSTMAVESWVSAFRVWLTADRHLSDVLLTIAFASSVAIAGGSVVLTTVDEPQGFTELFVLSQNETGAFVVGVPPTDVGANETVPMKIGVGNHEGERTEYSVVIEQQRLDTSGQGTQIVDSRPLSRFEISVEDGETKTVRRNLSPRFVGKHTRIVFLLFKSAPPSDPSVENAYREVHVWVIVSESSSLRRTTTG